ADPLAGHREQRLAPVVVQVRRAERTHDLGRFGCRARGHVPRLPSTAVARRSTPSRLLTIATVSPGWWLRSASVMSYKLAMCLSPIAGREPRLRRAAGVRVSCGDARLTVRMSSAIMNRTL